MTRLCKATLGLVLLLSVVTTVGAQSSLRLTGRATNVRVAEADKNTVVLTISLDLTITNDSAENVILFLDEFRIVGHRMFQNDDPIRPNVLYRDSSLPSIDRSSTWTDLQKQLDVSSPPAGLTRILRSGETMNLSRTTGMSIYKKGFYPAQWSEIRAAFPVWLQVELDVFPNNLNRISGSRKSFGKRLKKKWMRFGNLQLDVLQSAPIKLELNS